MVRQSTPVFPVVMGRSSFALAVPEQMGVQAYADSGKSGDGPTPEARNRRLQALMATASSRITRSKGPRAVKATLK